MRSCFFVNHFCLSMLWPREVIPMTLSLEYRISPLAIIQIWKVRMLLSFIELNLHSCVPLQVAMRPYRKNWSFDSSSTEKDHFVMLTYFVH